MTDLIAASAELAGLRRIPTERQISAWFRTLPQETRVQIEAAEQRMIDDAIDDEAAVAAVEREALALAPLVLRARF